MRINALDNAGFWKVCGHCVDDRLPQVRTIESLGQRLPSEHVVVLVDDEPGQQVGFAEDNAVGIGIACRVLAELDRSGDALADD